LCRMSMYACVFGSLLCCSASLVCFFFHVTAHPEIYPLSLHDALPISRPCRATSTSRWARACRFRASLRGRDSSSTAAFGRGRARSEEHTSELQSLAYLVCRLLLEKKKHIKWLSASLAPRAGARLWCGA